MIRQRYKDPLSLLLDGNVDPMIRITVCPLCYGKYICRVRMQLHMVFSYLPTQIAVQPVCVHLLCQLVILLLDPCRQFNRFLV